MTVSTDIVTGPDTDLRTLAVERLKKKRDLKLHLAIYALVNALLIGLWAFSGTSLFWPVFPLAGWGIGIVAHAYDVYGREPSEERIQREIERLR
jgi:hypothetical protein